MCSECLLEIAGVRFRLETQEPLALTKEFKPFLTAESRTDFTIRYRQVEVLPPIPAEVLHEECSYRVHPRPEGGYFRSFFDAPRDLTPYGVVYPGAAEGEVLVDYLEKGAAGIMQITNSFFYPGFEDLMLRKDRLCFHAACVDTPLGGILFSGRSGIGKSTQAELWCRYRGARQINGDRPVLSQSQSGWLAWGSPYAGSSGVHVNEHCAVSAIVMLRQAKECSLRRLDMGEAFRAVWSGMTVHNWDEKFVEKVCDLTMNLIADIPVYELACTPDEAAVTTLEQMLRKERSL